MLHSDIYALHNMATLFNNHSYISSSKLTGMPLLLLVGMMVELIMWPYYGVDAYHCVAFLVCVLVKRLLIITQKQVSITRFLKRNLVHVL